MHIWLEHCCAAGGQVTFVGKLYHFEGSEILSTKWTWRSNVHVELSMKSARAATHFAIHSNLFCFTPYSPRESMYDVDSLPKSRTATPGLSSLVIRSYYSQMWEWEPVSEGGVWWMRDQVRSADGKETRCCRSGVCTCVVVVRPGSRKTSVPATLAPGGEDFRQRVVHLAVSMDCTGSHCQNGQPSQREKPPSASNAPRSPEFFKGNVFKKHLCCRLLFGFGIELIYTQVSKPVMMSHVNFACPLLSFCDTKWHRRILHIFYLPVRACGTHITYGLQTPV